MHTTQFFTPSEIWETMQAITKLGEDHAKWAAENGYPEIADRTEAHYQAIADKFREWHRMAIKTADDHNLTLDQINLRVTVDNLKSAD